jgi:serine/threonine-protein kinase
MYEMITGKVPFDRPNSVNILMAHVNEEPAPMRQMNPAIHISPQIEDAVGRCMAKDPDQRFRSMDEVLAALKRIQNMGALTGTVSGVGTSEYRPLSGSGSGPRATSSGIVGSGANPTFLSSSGRSDVPSPLGIASDSPAAGALLASQMPGTSGSKAMLFAAVVGALVCAGLAGYLALRPRVTAPVGPSQFAAQAGTVSATTAVVAPPLTESLAPPAPAVVLVKVRVNTEPDGASVKEDGVELCSSTPCDIVYKGADADVAREHRLTFLHAGYRSETRNVRVGDSPVSVKLAVIPAGPRYVAPAAAPAPKGESPTLPPGYKSDVPY